MGSLYAVVKLGLAVCSIRACVHMCVSTYLKPFFGSVFLSL